MEYYSFLFYRASLSLRLMFTLIYYGKFVFYMIDYIIGKNSSSFDVAFHAALNYIIFFFILSIPQIIFAVLCHFFPYSPDDLGL